MIEILPITSKSLWEEFIEARKSHSFLHSWEWGEFNERLGLKIWRLGVFEGPVLRAIALIVKVRARRGSFFLLPHGPLLDFSRPEYLESLFKYLKELSAGEKVLFIRFCPLLEKSEENTNVFRRLGFRNSPIHTTPERVWILDLTKSEADILAGMRKQTRYSIKKAERDGVEIVMSKVVQDVNAFYSLYEATVERQHFIPFSREYIRKELEVFGKNDKALFFFAKYKNENVSSALIIFSNAGAFYHQGASLVKYPQLTASHLLHWEVIKEAKRRQCGFYNFWGISPSDDTRHPWAGPSLFKRGFGGFSEEYIPSQDFILSKKYWLTFLIEKIRKVRRGF